MSEAEALLQKAKKFTVFTTGVVVVAFAIVGWFGRSQEPPSKVAYAGMAGPSRFTAVTHEKVYAGNTLVAELSVVLDQKSGQEYLISSRPIAQAHRVSDQVYKAADKTKSKK